MALKGHSPRCQDAIVLVPVADAGHVLQIMEPQRTRAAVGYAAGVAVTFLALSVSCFAQETTIAMAAPAVIAPTPVAAPSTVVAIQPQAIQPDVLRQEAAHRFWDRENKVLFAAVAATSAADFAVTYSNLQTGGKELNPLTRVFAGSTAGLAANFAGETVGVVGLSYFFHKTGHHKLERMTSVLNITASGFAVGYSLRHR